MKKLHRLGAVLAVTLGIAVPAAAHNNIAAVRPAVDRPDESAAQEPVQSLPVVAKRMHVRIVNERLRGIGSVFDPASDNDTWAMTAPQYLGG